MSMKPPNILVYTGSESSELFTAVENDLLKCLQYDSYTVYQLLDSEVLKQPWMENTLLLIIVSDFIEHTVLSAAETFIQKYGNVLLVCSNFDGSLLGIKCHEASNKESIIQARFKNGQNLTLLRGKYFFDTGGTVLCEDGDEKPLIQKINHGENVLIISEVYLDRDLDISDKVPEYDSSDRISALKYILTEELGLEPKTEDFMPELTAGYYANISQTGISSNASTGKDIFRECTLMDIDKPLKLPIYFSYQPPFQSDTFDISRYSSKLKTRVYGQHIVYFPVVTSTMEVAGQLSEHDGIVVVSDIQTKGRGRANNKWISPKGCAMFTLHITVPLKSPLGRKMTLIQYIASVAFIHGVRSQPSYEDLELAIKWPNDIYSGKIKIGGLMVTSVVNGDTAHVNIGWGINVVNSRPTSCLNDVIDKHNSEHSSSIPHLHIDEVIALTLTQMEYFVQDFTERGPENLLARYYSYWMHSNQEVIFENEKGVVIGLNEYGFLNIRKRNGQIIPVQPGGNRFDIMKNLIYAA